MPYANRELLKPDAGREFSPIMEAHVAVNNDRDATAADMSARWVTIPNALSLLRLALTPVVVWLLLTGTTSALALALILMIIAELTDFFDGFLARALNQETELGRVIDPVCDVIYHVSVFLVFVKQGWMPPWMVFAVYARDLGVPYLRTLAKQRGVDVSVRFSGKVKTAIHGVVQIAVVMVALNYLPTSFAGGLETVYYALLAATIISVISLVDYAMASFAKPTE